ncbi:hypothetical protein B0H16DRAFT_1724777 [Mycena metata]|uniref:Uncharacterized protein n=1 Tax=Mycena metata TaxID=1033252 RepID=A0AAD7ISX8_9AGAR|nr:hypothetical protein B0H16DRAFT_1724777 [Mycena metata]
MSDHNYTLRPSSHTFWQDFHYRRQRRSRALRGSSDDGSHLPASAIPTAHPIVTFIPNRAVPIFTHIQNDGSLVTSSDPLSIRPVQGYRTINQAHARRDPGPPLVQPPGGYRYSSELTRRIEARQQAQPSAEELLLQRLQLGLRRGDANINPTHPSFKASEDRPEERRRRRGTKTTSRCVNAFGIAEFCH